MPVFLSREHFARGLPQLQATLQRLSGEDAFRPEAALAVLPRLMNTMVVLLADSGVAHVSHAVRGYLLVWRVLAALVQRFGLQERLAARLRRFVARPEARTKAHEPSLGELLALLSVSEHVGWREVAEPLLQEQLDRSVLWAGKADARLVTAAPAAGAALDAEWLAGWFRAQRVSLRLTAFHAAFLRALGTPDGVPLARAAAVCDQHLGALPAHLHAQLVRGVRRAHAIDDWAAFFEAACVHAPAPARLQAMLQGSVARSLRKSYTRQGMDFSRVQARGVSSILLRGASFERVAFVVDVSGSMGSSVGGSHRSRLDVVRLALAEILRERVTPQQQMELIRFESSAHATFGGLRQCTAATCAQALRAASEWDASGGTNFAAALDAALGLERVQAVYMLSDGEWFAPPDFVRQLAARATRQGVQIHATALCDVAGAALLGEIAALTGGTFRAVDEDEAARMLGA